MESGNLGAIIIGEGGELESKLIDRLEKNDIRVDKFETGIEETGRYKYVFVFPQKETGWEKIEWGKEARVTVIEREWDGGIKMGLDKDIDNPEIKVVRLRNLYGAGLVEDWWGNRAFEAAAANQNLELPAANTVTRWLYVDDGVEAIIRATILREIGDNKLEVWGKAVEIGELASELMDQAQMTKFKVKQTETETGGVEGETVEAEWERIRWQPEISLKTGIEETMQFFVSRWDEVSRLKKTDITTLPPKKKSEGREYGMAVVIEEPEEKVVTETYKEIVEPIAETRIEPEVEVERETEGELEPVFESPRVAEVAVIESEDEEMGEEIREEAGEMSNEWTQTKTEEIKAEEPKVVDDWTAWREKLVTKTMISEPPKGQKRIKLNLKNKWIYWGIIGMGLILVIANIASWVTPMVTVAREVSRGIKNGGWSEMEIKKVEINRDRLNKKLGQWGNSWWAGSEWGKRYGETGRVLVGAVEALVAADKMSKSGEKIMGAVWGEGEVDWKAETETMEVGYLEWQESSGKLVARLGGDWRWLPEGMKEKLEVGKTKLVATRKLGEKLGKIIAVLPELVAADGGRKEYLVLFQNEAELRATGGFIGSWGLLTFEGGRLVNFEVRDVYEGDGQLKGHVEPPEPIKTHLGEAGWFLRDANWNPDFRKSATDIGWFLEKETGRVVDGVVGVNLAVAKEILGVMGELKLPGFDTKINSTNLYEQAQFYAENKFFPGSKQKASFLGELANQLFEEVKSAKGVKKWQIGQSLAQLAEKREIQVWIKNEKEGAVFNEMGWDGALFGGECRSQRCLADYLFPVDSNLGVNKANFFVRRKVEVGVELGTNTVARVVRINWENTSRSSSWPGGDYKNYFRIYLPMGINLASVVLSDGTTGQVVKTYTGSELKQETVGGKTVVGMLVMVPIVSHRILEMRYSTTVNLGAEDNFSYLMYAQKQSGWGDTGLVAVVNIPEGWQPMQAEPAATSAGGKLLFNLRWDRDIKLGVEVGR